MTNRLLPWLLALVLGAALVAVLWPPAGPDSAPAEVQVTQQVAIIEKIEAVGKLELVKYKLKDVVEITKPSGSPFIPDARVLLVVAGEAAGCLDLTKMTAARLREGTDTLVLQLPAPELCYYKINHADSRVYNTQFTLINGEAGLVDEAYRRAEEQVRQSAEAYQLLEQTKLNAQHVLLPLLRQLTTKHLVLQFDPLPAKVGPGK
jgi:hypothetical protein